MTGTVICRMVRKVWYKNKEIEYQLHIKNVKNINIRINSDGIVSVSANKYEDVNYIDSCIVKNGERILSIIENKIVNSKNKPVSLYSEEEFTSYVNKCFQYVNSLFYEKIKIHPVLQMKNVYSYWGKCNYVKNIITLSTNLIYCTKEQIYYVIVHEFAHFLVHNHSKEFFCIVGYYCENYKEIRKEMKKINISRG